MVVSKKFSSLIVALLLSILLMLFSFFIHYDFPLKIISVAALLVSGFIISRDIRTVKDLTKLTGDIPSARNVILLILTGIAGAIILSAGYRWHLDASIFPRSFQWFALVAASIGSMEELVFRGYLQDSVKSYGAVVSVSLSTLAHTGYKCLLFAAPVIAASTNIGFLAFWTIVAGLIYGTIKHYTNSIIPSLIGHALFDILVYAEFVRSPWWVW